MRASLVCGHRYSAKVYLEPCVRAVLSPELLRSELRRYQLFGQIHETAECYIVQAEFRGQTGTYDLPAAVRSITELT